MIIIYILVLLILFLQQKPYESIHFLDKEQLFDLLKNDNDNYYKTFNKNDYNQVVGFIGYKKGNKYMAFKTKDMNSKRDTGAICEDATKDKNLTKLNNIIGEEKYTIQSTKAVKDKDGNIIQEPLGNTELCVLKEFIIRYFNAVDKDNKKYCLTPEMAIYHKLYTVFV